MNRVVTRGLGPNHLLITRGFGISSIIEQVREVLRLCSCLGRQLVTTSKITISMLLKSKIDLEDVD